MARFFRRFMKKTAQPLRASLKYYVYISDTKVDMLLPQVPHEVKERIATKLEIDLKLLSATRTSEIETSENRITRLEAVVAYIREHGDVGPVDQPGEYIEDTLPMCWGRYGPGQDSPLVYFGGTTSKTIIGLGGSTKHVLGSTGTSYSSSASLTPNLVSYLTSELGLDKALFMPPYDLLLAKTPDWPLRAVELRRSG